MSETTKALAAGDMYFLAPFLPPGSRNPETGSAAPKPSINSEKDEKLPFVTLTWAQSMDGMIASAPGQRTTLSGPETKSMTHFLRAQHDAILVGVSTAVADNPALNCRYPGATLDDQPRPVIVDPHMRFAHGGSKMAQLEYERKGKAPWLITRPRKLDNPMDQSCRVVKCDEEGPFNVNNLPYSSFPIFWRSILEALKHEGINSVMIEGGAQVISTLLTIPELVDSVIITQAPTWIGQGGVAIAPRKAKPKDYEKNPATLKDTSYRKFGDDLVTCGRPHFPQSTDDHPLTLNFKKTPDNQTK